GLVIAAVMASLFSAALLIGGPWLYRALGRDGEILAAALAYSNAIFAGALAYWVLGTLTSVVRGTGQPGCLRSSTSPPSSCTSRWGRSGCGGGARCRRWVSRARASPR